MFEEFFAGLKPLKKCMGRMMIYSPDKYKLAKFDKDWCWSDIPEVKEEVATT